MFKKLRKKILNNFGYKITSLIIAIILWIIARGDLLFNNAK